MAAQKQHPHDDGGSMKKKITHRSIDRWYPARRLLLARNYY
jgi:hypothetical protein